MGNGSYFTDTDLRDILCTEENWVGNDSLQVYPFSEDSLTPAGYDLRVGYQYTSTKRGKTFKVGNGEEVLVPSGDTCLITTLESIGMPRDRSLSGLIVSTVTMVAKGLSHVSTSVDADWSGELMIVLHNHAPNVVKLKVGERLCTLVLLSNRTASTKSCGVFAGRNDVFRDRLLEATRKSQRRRDTLSLVPVLIIPLALLLGYLIFDNKPGMIATTAAGIAVAGMLYPYFRERWRS
jgi:dCTP deaminase